MSAETRSFALSRADGSVAVMQIIRQPDGGWPGVAECLAKWPAAERAAIVAHREIARADIPADRGFRDAWTDPGAGAIATDMPRARAIHMARIRAVRDAELLKNDAAYSAAQKRGDGAAMAAIAAEAQALRDLPNDIQPAVDAAATPEALAALWPAGLPARP